MDHLEAAAAQNLADAVAWCGVRASARDARTSVRTPELRPPLLDGTDDEVVWRLVDGSFDALAAAVQHVCTQRGERLRQLGISAHARTGGKPDLEGGRVLVTDFQTDLCVAAEPESHGFYDANDVPGWDTWFHCEPAPGTSGLLYCYVPRQLVQLADRGMWAIPVECVRWV
jgi:hypothetical protein